MADGKRLKTGDNEFYLPEDVIQHIQSFLDGREAARTSFLSNSWYRAWLGRPTLEFDELRFPALRVSNGENESQNADRFWNFMRKTIQRYENMNLKVHTFKLLANSSSPRSPSLFDELMTKVVNMGVKEIELHPVYPHFHLPYWLLQAETLVRLTVWWCEIDRPPPSEVNFSKLKFLTMVGTHIRGDDYNHMFPCLEDLIFECCFIKEPIHVSSNSLKNISLEFNKKFRVKFDVPNVRKFKLLERCSPTVFPAVSISAGSREWEADITFFYKKCSFGPSWPNLLKTFLNKLGAFRISLGFSFSEAVICNYGEDLKGKPGPVVDNLKLSMGSLPKDFPRFLARLIWSSQPMFITLSRLPCSLMQEEKEAFDDFMRFLSKEMLRDEESCCSKIQNMFGNRGLENVNLECFNATWGEWQPLPSKSTLWSRENIRGVRFMLKWSCK